MEWYEKKQLIFNWNVLVCLLSYADLSVDIYFSSKYYNSKQYNLLVGTVLICFFPVIVQFFIRKQFIYLNLVAEYVIFVYSVFFSSFIFYQVLLLIY